MPVPSRPALQLVAACLVTGLTAAACSVFAGLKDEVIVVPPGFLDSRNAPCSDGNVIVDCASLPPNLARQDGNQEGPMPAFQSVGTNLAKELNTGLVWWTIPSPDLDWESAKKKCEDLGDGFRLPTRLELATIVEFNLEGPTLVDESIFEGIMPGNVWTGTHYVHDDPLSEQYWIFNVCTDCEPSYSSYGLHTSNPVTTLCVKGEVWKTGPLTDQNDGTLLDETTRLLWIADPKPPSPNGLSWPEAVQYCKELTVGQHEDWRLPTIKELQTIVDDETTAFLAVDRGFILSGSQKLWSGTPLPSGNDFYQILTEGGTVTHGSENYIYASCVRNAD